MNKATITIETEHSVAKFELPVDKAQEMFDSYRTQCVECTISHKPAGQIITFFKQVDEETKKKVMKQLNEIYYNDNGN